MPSRWRASRAICGAADLNHDSILDLILFQGDDASSLPTYLSNRELHADPVTRNVRWISDATEWGQHDYWASAAETLQHGAGDMEDRAIVKMQALKSLGFSTRDLYLTVGRDKVGGQIIVLLVQLDGRFYILDDLGGAPIAADLRRGIEPMVTHGLNNSWIHGRRRLSPTLATMVRVAGTPTVMPVAGCVMRMVGG